jgi:hypothetical protein
LIIEAVKVGFEISAISLSIFFSFIIVLVIIGLLSLHISFFNIHKISWWYFYWNDWIYRWIGRNWHLESSFP